MSMRAPYILLSSSKAAAARAFHPSLPPSPVRGSSAAAKAAKAREGEAASKAAAPRRAKPLATPALVVLCRSVTKRDIASLARSLARWVGRSASFLLFADRTERTREERQTSSSSSSHMTVANIKLWFSKLA